MTWQGERTLSEASPKLIRFQKRYCPDFSIDSDEFFSKLIDEYLKLREEMKLIGEYQKLREEDKRNKKT